MTVFFLLKYIIAAREDKLNATNRSVVNNFQAELAGKIGVLCNTITLSTKQQNEYLQTVEKLCQSCLDFHDKVAILGGMFNQMVFDSLVNMDFYQIML